MCVCPFNVCAAACVCMPRVHSTCVFCLVLVGITVHHSGLLQKAISQNFDTFECTQTFMNPFSWKSLHFHSEHGMAEQVVLAPCITWAGIVVALCSPTVNNYALCLYRCVSAFMVAVMHLLTSYSMCSLLYPPCLTTSFNSPPSSLQFSSFLSPILLLPLSNSPPYSLTPFFLPSPLSSPQRILTDDSCLIKNNEQ